MKASRTCLLPVTLIFGLLALFSYSHAQDGVDPVVQALRQLDQSAANGQLSQAESQLKSLQQLIPGDTRLEQAERQISAGYLQQGKNALQKGDLGAAKATLSKVQSLGAAAAAQSAPLAAAIDQAEAQAAQQAAKQAAAKRAAETEAKAAAARAEQARQQRLAAEAKAAAAKTQARATEVARAAPPAKPEAQLIDPTASSSVIALPMLDNKDNDKLRALLDQAAIDVVSFNCMVQVKVRASKNYPWVFALLSARVKAIDPDFNLVIDHTVDPAQEPQLILTPQS